MPRKVVLDDKIADITQTRVWQVLEEFNYMGGNGLTANALCCLTKQPWSVVKHVLTERTGPKQISGMYCGDVHAPVFFNWYGADQKANILRAYSKHVITKASAIIRKYPPPKFQGAAEEKGEKLLTFHMFEGIWDDRERKKQNVRLAKDLMAVWKENA